MAAVLAAGWVAAASEAAAESEIGAAVVVQREVSGLVSGRDRQIAVGDDLYTEEVVRTGAASAARLLFLDETSLSMGAAASVKLDRFVYNPDRSATTVVVDATRGAFRWISGASDPRAYRIRTPLATIGVRGTVFDFLVERARLTVVLQDGRIAICPHGRRCVTVEQPGEVVYVTRSGGATPPRPGGPETFDFADVCLQGNRDLCAQAPRGGDAPFVPLAVPVRDRFSDAGNGEGAREGQGAGSGQQPGSQTPGSGGSSSGGTSSGGSSGAAGSNPGGQSGGKP
ncbi:FecR domain-containing protein [Chelatococcus sp. SYSU_G07232]|uniref:FecR domain-containing protein n=1 Tax=Chelatococcus albus TaxID=3047466 RepID=A0ABT7ACF9_9HYPH|nr:FecR domain-containing protein [Chelatococcus sp. SYSU_G07232]MDJ1157013.1 FecR domain-containing protein [Chelatococcus sp. SYSU_G07232]